MTIENIDKEKYRNWIDHSHEIRKHILSDKYPMTSITCSENIARLYFIALKNRQLMPKLKEIRNWLDFKCWLLGHLIKSIHNMKG